jgi:hypothetical protein
MKKMLTFADFMPPQSPIPAFDLVELTRVWVEECNGVAFVMAERPNRLQIDAIERNLVCLIPIGVVLVIMEKPLQ